MTPLAEITGGSHAPRAVLQTAEEFQDVTRSTAEYIHNAFQYRRDRATPATVLVQFGRDSTGKWYEISDFANGAGMDAVGLNRFFTMHAPNEDRVRGDAGRGRNGTGKAAAFGVGDTLTVYTVQEGIANEVQLTKADLQSYDKVYPCERLPTQHTVRNEALRRNDPQYGTRIRVSGIRQDFDENTIIRNLQRLFQRQLDYHYLIWKKGADLRRVVRPHHATILDQPYPAPPELHPFVGEVTLHLSASDVDLHKGESGIIVTSLGGNVVEDNYIDVVKRRSIADKRIFGFVDIPMLDLPDDLGRVATTQARRPQMNRECERVSKLLPWLDQCIDDFREKVEAIIERGADEADKAALDAIANTLEHVLNDRYRQFMREYSARMKLPKAISGGFPDSGPAGPGGPDYAGEGDAVYVPIEGGDVNVTPDESGDITIATNKDGNASGGGTEAGTSGNAMGRVDPTGKPSVRKTRGPKPTSAGASLHVRHSGLGTESARAYYNGEGTFTINIDHPDFAGLEKSDPQFMRRSAEGVAATYAQAMVEMRLKDGDPTCGSPMEALNAFMDEHDKVLRPLLEACS